MEAPMYATIDSLRDISRRCLSAQPLSDEQLNWLGQSLAEFLAHRTRSVDEALGLRFGRGGVPWWREEAMRKRDAALRQLADRFHAGLSVSAQARIIRGAAIRFGASAWRRDRELDAMPAYYAGREHEWLWRAFASGAPMPIGERQLRHVLGR
jgi:hypothetical protein